jgi:excisionase family DNA binding protein
MGQGTPPRSEEITRRLAYPEIMTPDHAADYLKVNREPIYRYIRNGRLTASRIGRSYRIRKQRVALLPAATSTRPDLHLRTYTDRQLEELLEQDQLDDETRAAIQSLGFDRIQISLDAAS